MSERADPEALIERLRQESHSQMASPNGSGFAARLLREAATRIEALEDEKVRTHAALRFLADVFQSAANERDEAVALLRDEQTCPRCGYLTDTPNHYYGCAPDPRAINPSTPMPEGERTSERRFGSSVVGWREAKS